MSIRINLILIWLGLLVQGLANPFQRSDLTVSLESNGPSKPVPFHHEYSCQLVVFQVYNDNYTLTVEVKDHLNTHVQVKFNSSGDCRMEELVGKSASFSVVNTKYE